MRVITYRSVLTSVNDEDNGCNIISKTDKNYLDYHVWNYT